MNDENDENVQLINQTLRPIYRAIFGKHRKSEKVIKYLCDFLFRAENQQQYQEVVELNVHHRRLEEKEKDWYELCLIESYFINKLVAIRDLEPGYETEIDLIKDRYKELHDMTGRFAFSFVSNHFEDIARVLSQYNTELENRLEVELPTHEESQYAHFAGLLHDLSPKNKNFIELKDKYISAVRFWGEAADIEENYVKMTIDDILKEKK